MASTATMTGSAFDQLPYEEGRKWDLIQGELIAVSGATPEHQIIVGNLFASMREYLRQHRAGGLLVDSEFALGEADRVRPDLAILLTERWASLDRKRTPIPMAPDIAVEVLSPSERTTDSLRKIWTYLGSGVQEV